MKKIWGILGYILYLAVVSSLLAYLLFVVYRTNKLYEYIKKPHSGWEGAVHQEDDILGYRPIPGAYGYEVYENGKRVVLQYDDMGFRVPAKWAPVNLKKKPVLLFIGDSFTYGSACMPEESFPYIVGKDLGVTSINAGVISYGFSQMVTMARKWIPEIKPDYIFVQSSPWLLTRTMDMYRQAPYGVLPMPYFAKVDGKIQLMPPPYTTKIFKVPVEKFKKTKKDLKDKIRFFVEVGFPFYLDDDIHRVWTSIKVWLEILPPPSKDAAAIEFYTYNEIHSLCMKYRCRMVIVFLGTTKQMYEKREQYFKKITNLITVDAESALWDGLKEKTQREYDLKYKHLRNTDPPKVLDHHPNPKAHRIIAEEIEKKVKPR